MLVPQHLAFVVSRQSHAADEARPGVLPAAVEIVVPHQVIGRADVPPQNLPAPPLLEQLCGLGVPLPGRRVPVGPLGSLQEHCVVGAAPLQRLLQFPVDNVVWRADHRSQVFHNIGVVPPPTKRTNSYHKQPCLLPRLYGQPTSNRISINQDYSKTSPGLGGGRKFFSCVILRHFGPFSFGDWSISGIT